MPWPTVDDYKAWARIYDNTDDVAIGETQLAVQAAITTRCPNILTMMDVPEPVQLAAMLWTNRLMSRRNSPDGIVGVADLGIATIPKADKDINDMLAPYRAVVMS